MSLRNLTKLIIYATFEFVVRVFQYYYLSHPFLTAEETMSLPAHYPAFPPYSFPLHKMQDCIAASSAL